MCENKHTHKTELVKRPYKKVTYCKDCALFKTVDCAMACDDGLEPETGVDALHWWCTEYDYCSKGRLKTKEIKNEVKI